MKTHVLLCSHNGANYIEQQIASILAQTVAIDCLHIYDFSSTDGTLQCLERLATCTPQLVLHSARVAQGAETSFMLAMQDLAAKVAATDCIFLCDQDDVWQPHKVAQVLHAFHTHIAPAPCLLIFHDVIITDEKLQTLQPTFYTGNPYQVPRDLDAERMLLCNPVIGHTMAISGQLLQNFSRHTPAGHYLMHDWALSLFAKRYGHIVFIEEALSFYRQHANNVLGTLKKRKISEKFNRIFNFCRQLKKQTDFHLSFIQAMDKKLKPNTLPAEASIKNINSGKSVYPYMIEICLKKGPTTKRKLLSAVLLLVWVQSFFTR